MVFKLQRGHKYMTEITIYNVQWATTPKVGKPELGFLCSACHLMVLYISVRFHKNISKVLQVTEQTQVHERNHYVYLQSSMGHNSSKETRYVVLMFFMLSGRAFIFL